MKSKNLIVSTVAKMLLGAMLTGNCMMSTVVAQSGVHKPVSPYHPFGLSPSARNFYQVTWGVDPVGVKQVSSGLMLRFSYRVVDAEKAKTLNDKRAEPYLLDEGARVTLVVPTMEKVGQLRQTGTLEAGKTYWMVFSNKGQYVKVGDRVSVVIGQFRVDGLVVE